MLGLPRYLIKLKLIGKILIEPKSGLRVQNRPNIDLGVKLGTPQSRV